MFAVFIVEWANLMRTLCRQILQWLAFYLNIHVTGGILLNTVQEYKGKRGE